MTSHVSFVLLFLICAISFPAYENPVKFVAIISMTFIFILFHWLHKVKSLSEGGDSINPGTL